MNSFFSFSGRLRRKDFWINSIILWIAYGVIVGVLFMLLGGMAAVAAISTDSDPEETAVLAGSLGMFFLVTGLVSVPYVIASLALSVRRWHDLNKSGWWIFVSLVPFIGGLYAFIMTGFVEGTRGQNGYGEDPKAAERLF